MEQTTGSSVLHLLPSPDTSPTSKMEPPSCSSQGTWDWWFAPSLLQTQTMASCPVEVSAVVRAIT